MLDSERGRSAGKCCGFYCGVVGLLLITVACGHPDGKRHVPISFGTKAFRPHAVCHSHRGRKDAVPRPKPGNGIHISSHGPRLGQARLERLYWGRALMPRRGWIAQWVTGCMRPAKMWTHPMKGFMLGLSTGKDVPVSPLHIFASSVHSKTN